jgi:protease-4
MTQSPESIPSGRHVRERSILFIFVAFVLGFALPVCSCFGLTVAAISSLSSIGGQTTGLPVATSPAVAVIALEGIITSQGDLYSQNITPEQVSELLATAEADPFVEAIVLRIDSPGGGVVASDEIFRMLQQIDMPIVVSMGSMAASGGYYIACAADHVVAHPDTLTGSIGVIIEFPNVEGLLDKVGVEVIVLTAGEVKDIGSLYREITAEEVEIWEQIIDEAYEGFVSIVAEGRELSLERVRELADGRVYTGRQALEVGLVDEVGTLDIAISKAAELAGISGEPEIIELFIPYSFYDILSGYQTNSTLPLIQDMVSWGSFPSLEYRYAGP